MFNWLPRKRVSKPLSIILMAVTHQVTSLHLISRQSVLKWCISLRIRKLNSFLLHIFNNPYNFQIGWSIFFPLQFLYAQAHCISLSTEHNQKFLQHGNAKSVEGICLPIHDPILPPSHIHLPIGPDRESTGTRPDSYER